VSATPNVLTFTPQRRCGRSLLAPEISTAVCAAAVARRKQQPDRGALANLALDLDIAAHHQAVYLGKSEAHSLARLVGHEERIESTRDDIRQLPAKADLLGQPCYPESRRNGYVC
jgi:hypothetical protein